MQENQNRDLKKLIKNMSANKTDKAIEHASKAVGGVRKAMQNFDVQVATKLNQMLTVTNPHP